MPPPTRGGDIVFELFVRAAVCLSAVRRVVSMFSESISAKLAVDIQRVSGKNLRAFQGQSSKVKVI